MKKIAETINIGTTNDPMPYSTNESIRSKDPMIVMEGMVGIVYNPDNIK